MKVLISVLAYNRTVSTPLAISIVGMASDQRVEKEFLFVQMCPIEEARNFAMQTFLDRDYDYMIMIDDDTACPKNPIDFCFMGKDLIFCPYIMHKDDTFTVSIGTDTVGERKGLQEVTKAGTGCFMISRKAAEKIEKPHFAFEHDKNGRMTAGEDVYFCEKARKHFKLYVHWDYFATHEKIIDLNNFFFVPKA